MTFRHSRRLPFHRWYPYVEGFSANYIGLILSGFRNARAVYDPFGGCGTTLVEASIRQIPSFYSEVNPFMRFVTETKVNAARMARDELTHAKGLLSKYLAILKDRKFPQRGLSVDLDQFEDVFPGRDYFAERDLRDLLVAKDIALEICDRDDPVQRLMLLALASVTVDCSNMTRRADLRRRRADEYRTRRVNVRLSLESKINEIVTDLDSPGAPVALTTKVSDDARNIGPDYNESFDVAITSPPYLNGTNYFRNTKLELWLLDFIRSEKDLGQLRSFVVPSGITDVSRSTPVLRKFISVEKVVDKLERHSYDVRIPRLVRVYFDRIYEVLERVHMALRPEGKLIIDIGDSRFSGILVPTDFIVSELAQSLGFHLSSSRTLAKRYSRDKTPLKQVELIMEKSK